MGNETFIDWRLGTQAGFDSVVPLGSRHDELQCRRPGSAPLSDWSRAITPHGQRTWVDEGHSASARFARLSNTDKLGMALRSAAQAVGPEMGHKLLALISPTNLAIMAGALAIWVGAHATPVGWVVDIGMVGLGVVALGAEAVNVMRELYAFAMGVIKARSEADLMQAGRHLAKAMAIVGVDVVVALLLKKAIVKVRQPRAHGSKVADGPKLFGKYDPKDAAKSLPAEPVGAKAPDTTSGINDVVAAQSASGATKEVLGRKALGADGAKSVQIIERENGKMISRTHEVAKDGKILHQHQNHTGKYGGERQFPDEWTGTKTINAPYENIPPSFPADRVSGGRTF